MRMYLATVEIGAIVEARHSSDKLKYSIEHGKVKVVAVNDPFIEPHYAVSQAFHDNLERGLELIARIW